MHLQILDLDGSLAAQPSLSDVAPWESIRHIPLSDLAPRLRLWSRDATMRQARERIAASATDAPSVTLIGSGDFHHLATLLHERIREPFTLIHLDNHPDWVRLAPRWHCGSWVNRALELPNLARIFTLGPCSDDLVRPDRKGGNLPALASGKLVLMPWRHAPSRIWRALPDGLGHRYADGALEWRVALQARRQPLLEPFQVQQRAQVLVAVVHAEQQLPEALGQRAVGGRARGHRAVVVRRCLRENPDRAGREHALAREQQQVRVDHAGRVHRVGAEQGAGRVALAADVVAVQPDADVEAPHLDIGAGAQPH